MLYSSFFPTNGVAMLCSYAPQAQGIGIGITGGGVVIEGSVSSVPLPWEDLQRDLLLGSKFSNELYIFSLEGCVWNDYLKKINAINWNSEVVMPLHKTEQVNRIRKIGRYTLWALSNPGWVALGLLALAMFLGSLRRLVKWLS
jgi:hypothetical protein